MAEGPSIQPPQGPSMAAWIDAVKRTENLQSALRQDIQRVESAIVPRFAEPAGAARGGEAPRTGELDRRLQVTRQTNAEAERGAQAEVDRLTALKQQAQVQGEIIQQQQRLAQRLTGRAPVILPGGGQPSAAELRAQEQAQLQRQQALASRLTGAPGTLAAAPPPLLQRPGVISYAAISPRAQTEAELQRIGLGGPRPSGQLILPGASGARGPIVVAQGGYAPKQIAQERSVTEAAQQQLAAERERLALALKRYQYEKQDALIAREQAASEEKAAIASQNSSFGLRTAATARAGVPALNQTLGISTLAALTGKEEQQIEAALKGGLQGYGLPGGVLHYGQERAILPANSVVPFGAAEGSTRTTAPQLIVPPGARQLGVSLPGTRNPLGVGAYAADQTGAANAIGAYERASAALPRFKQQMQEATVIQAQASQQMRRHGALTTEFLQALARGETTLAEFRFQIGSTIAKFAGWTLAAASVYGVLGAITVLGRGAKDASAGVQQLNRFITNVDTSKAAQGFRDVSREVNVSITEVANAQANFLRIYHDQGQALEASRTALKLTKLDNLSAADSLRFLTAAAQEFKLPASDIVVLGDKLANVFRTMGVPIQESLPAFARSAAVVKNAGGDLTQLIELIAIARRQTGQTGNLIGTAFARSAANFVNRPSSQAVFQQLGLDPKQATDQYTAFVLNAIRRARTLSAPEIRNLAAAIGGPQYGARIFTGLLRGFQLLPQAAKSAGAESAGTLDRELKVKLAQVDEQLKAVGNGMERLGSALGSAGVFGVLGIALKTLNLMLSTVTGLVEAFDRLPGPVKDMAVYLGEAYVALRLFRRTGLGQAAAESTGLQFLGYTPRQQLTRRAITAQRGLVEAGQNRLEQLGNQTAFAANGAISAQSALADTRLEVKRLAAQAEAGVVGASKQLETANAALVVQTKEAFDLNAEANRLQRQYNAALAQNVIYQEGLVGLQKGTLLPSQVAERQGSITFGDRGLPVVVSPEQARRIEQNGPGGRYALRQVEGAAGTVSPLWVPAAAGAAREIPPVAELDNTTSQVNLLKSRTGAINPALGKMGTGFAGLGAAARTAGAAAERTAATVATGVAELGGVLLNPLIIGLAGLELIPAIYQARVREIKRGDATIAKFGSGPQNQAQADQARRGLPAPLSGTFSQKIEELRIAQTNALAEQAIARAQRDARAAGQPVPERFTANITADFAHQADSYRRGTSSAGALGAAYKKYREEVKRSREAESGSEKGRQAVTAAEHDLRITLLAAADGVKGLGTALSQASLGELSGLLQAEAAKLDVFGVTGSSLPKIAAEFNRATALVAADPTPQNLKDFTDAKKGFDALLQSYDTELQNALSLATTQAQRDAAYAHQYARFDALRRKLVAAPAAQQGNRVQQAEEAVQQAKAQQTAIEDKYKSNKEQLDALDKAFRPSKPVQQFEGGLRGENRGLGLNQQFDRQGAEAARKEVDAQAAVVKRLQGEVTKQHVRTKHLAEILKQRKQELDIAERNLVITQTQEQNQIGSLQAQLTAGRLSDPIAGLAVELKAANDAVMNDVKHHIGGLQRLQDELTVQNLQDSAYQAQIDKIAQQGALQQSRIDPSNRPGTDRAQLDTLYKELAQARKGHHGPAQTKEIGDLIAQINQARFQLADDVRSQAQAETEAYYAFAESKTDDPVKIARLEYQKAVAELKYAHGPGAQQQAEAVKNTAKRTLLQTIADERLKTINFEASIGKLTTDGEIAALKRLLHYAGLGRDTRRSILQQIYQLQHENDSQLELNVGNVRLPTLYDVRRLAGRGTEAGRQTTVTQVNHVAITAHGASADDIALGFHQHAATSLKSVLRMK